MAAMQATYARRVGEPAAESAAAPRPAAHRRQLAGLRPSSVRLNRCSCGGTCPECRARRAASGPAAPPIVHEVLRSPGSPMPAPERRHWEAQLGIDLSGVRIHADSRAAVSARAVRGRAYTVGDHVVLGEDASLGDRRLVAHELAHVAQQRGAGPVPSQLEVAPRGAPSEREADAFAHGAATATAQRPVTLSRYAHQDCSESDLRAHIWPSDYLARQMVDKALRALATPVDPAVTPLLTKYFRTSSPDLTRIRAVYQAIADEFADNDYTYECEDDCDANAYTWSGLVGVLTQAHIHLCMNNLRGNANTCIARSIVHEMSHRYAGTDDIAYCHTGCSFAPCPTSLTADQALNNAGSYGSFAWELWSTALTPAAPAAGGGGGGSPDAGVAGSAGPTDAGLPGGV